MEGNQTVNTAWCITEILGLLDFLLQIAMFFIRRSYSIYIHNADVIGGIQTAVLVIGLIIGIALLWGRNVRRIALGIILVIISLLLPVSLLFI